MNRLQLAALLIALAGSALGGLLPGDAGYQYDRPAFGTDFGRLTRSANLENFGRFPGRPSANYGPAAQGQAGNYGGFDRQPAGFGFSTGQIGYQGNQGFNQGFQGFQGTGQGYQGFQGDGSGSYREFDGGDNGRPRPYSFEYEVRDPATNNDYGQRENGDGNGSVRGEYRVLLPDSRTQIVRYTADDANGYVADVRYEGQAQQSQFGRPRFFGDGGAGFFGSGGAAFQPGRGGYNAVGASGDGLGGGGSSYAGRNQYLPPGGGSYGK